METVNKVNDYSYSQDTSGKKWKRGNVLYSTGKMWVTQSKCVPEILKTNLDTGKMEIASMKMHKKFLTPESYQQWIEQLCVRM